MPNDYLYSIDWDKINIDGFGYVVMDNNQRIDFADNDKEDIYKSERENYNNLESKDK